MACRFRNAGASFSNRVRNYVVPLKLRRTRMDYQRPLWQQFNILRYSADALSTIIEEPEMNATGTFRNIVRMYVVPRDLCLKRMPIQRKLYRKIEELSYGAAGLETIHEEDEDEEYSRAGTYAASKNSRTLHTCCTTI